MAQIAFQESLNVIHCASCGMQFGITGDFEQRRRKDHASFYCPSGHTNIYHGETDAERLRRELVASQYQLQQAKHRADMESNARRNAERQASRARNQFKRLSARANHGICPHCHRTVKQMAAHIASKHPNAK